MATTRYFVESDYDLTVRLQELFQETVNLQTMLNNADIESARLKDERRELAMRKTEVHHEMSLLVTSMKHLISDTGIVKNRTPQTINTSSRSIH